MSSDLHAWLLIGGMAGITYLTRMSGLFAARWLPTEGPVRRGLDAVPGCVLVALLLPRIAQGGLPEWSAAALTLLVAGSRMPAIVPIAAGVALLIAWRWLVGG